MSRFNDEERKVEEHLSAFWHEYRPLIITVVAVMVLLLVAVKSFAGTAVVTWTQPTQYTDGTALALADISQTRVEYGTCSGTAFGTKAGEQIATGTGTTLTVNSLPAGTYCLRAYTTAKGVESAASSVASAVVPQSPPKPPVLVTVTTTAYAVTVNGWRFAMVPVGTVPLGTACRADLKIAGFNAIPTSAVTTQYRAPIYWSKCA